MGHEASQLRLHACPLAPGQNVLTTRNGILMQPKFRPGALQPAGMRPQPDADILENRLEQLREMIAQDATILLVVWGLQ
jgi:hypothetical protein